MVDEGGCGSTLTFFAYFIFFPSFLFFLYSLGKKIGKDGMRGCWNKGRGSVPLSKAYDGFDPVINYGFEGWEITGGGLGINVCIGVI